MRFLTKKAIGGLWACGLAVLAGMSVAGAEETTIGEKGFTLGPRATFVKPKDADEGKWFAGVQTRLHLGQVMALEGSIDYRRHNYDPDTRIKVYPVQASLMAYLTPQYAVSPYLLGGAGWYFTRVEGPNGFHDTDNRFGPHAGAGLEIALNHALSLDASYRYIWLETVQSRDLGALEKDYDDSGYMVTAGLNFRF